MVEDSWVVLVEHLLPVGWVPIDAAGADMLLLEAALAEQGIEVFFDPFRPGEAGGFTRDCAQSVKLMVKQADLERARAAADELGVGSDRV